MSPEAKVAQVEEVVEVVTVDQEVTVETVLILRLGVVVEQAEMEVLVLMEDHQATEDLVAMFS
jgi:hypothetical protein